jgi:nucleotide-binding universal stress UspA family protein
LADIQKILCPIDFFQPSEVAMSYAALVAKNWDATLHLVHVIPPVASVSGLAESTGERVKAQHEEAQLNLGTIAEGFDSQGIRTSIENRFGEIDRQILSAVDESKADLVVMATHGRRGFQHWLIGSVCERILRTVPVPVLVVRTDDKSVCQPKIEKVLVGVDFSIGSKAAVLYGFDIIRGFDAELTLLHVPDFVVGDVPDPYKRPVIEGIHLELQKLIPGDATSGGVTTQVDFGIPYQVILRFAERNKADLIILGTQGRTMLDRTLLGSSTDRVVRGSGCSVLTIPPARVA